MFRRVIANTMMALVITGICIGKSRAVNVQTYIPIQAPAMLKIVNIEQIKFWPAMPTPWYFGGLIEQESCLSLTHSKCWNPRSQLKSAREEGAGLGQITRAYKTDGSIRFDSLQAMIAQHNAELKEMSWSNVYIRPDLQIRTMLLMTRDNYKQLFKVANPNERLNMSDAAYNGGMSGVYKQRLQCGLKKNCDPQVWFKNVGSICVKSLKPLYGGKNACDINTEHVFNVRYLRMNKYKPYFE